MMTVSSPPTSLSPEKDAPAAPERVNSCSSHIDLCTAVDLGRARIELPNRGVAARRARRATRGPWREAGREVHPTTDRSVCAVTDSALTSKVRTPRVREIGQ
eukprot:7220929-Prymnesium_polylepis.2